MVLSTHEMRAILRLLEAKTIFKSPEEFNCLYELWQKIEAEIKKDCEEAEDV